MLPPIVMIYHIFQNRVHNFTDAVEKVKGTITFTDAVTIYIVTNRKAPTSFLTVLIKVTKAPVTFSTEPVIFSTAPLELQTMFCEM